MTVSRNNTARIWDAATGRALTPPLAHNPSLVRKDDFLEGLHPMFASFSPDGTRVVTGAIDGMARLWDANTGRMLTPPLPHPDWVSYLSFSPDGKLVATACKDGAVRLWNTATGEAVGKPFQHGTWANFVEFSPNGDRILTGADDKIAQVWEIASGARLGQPLRHGGDLKYGEFWDATTGYALTSQIGYGGGLEVFARFSPDGRAFLTASSDGTTRIWPVGYKPSEDQPHLIGRDGTATTWPASLTPMRTRPLRHQGRVHYAEFSVDNGPAGVTTPGSQWPRPRR